MYKAQNLIIADAGEIAAGAVFTPEDNELQAEEIERLLKIGAITELDSDPVDAEESEVESIGRTKTSRKRTK